MLPYPHPVLLHHHPEHWSFSPNWTSFTLPWAWTSMPLDFLHHHPEHWSFSPNWTSFTLPWGWTSMFFTTSQSTGLSHQLVLLHPVLGNGLLAAFLHHIPEHWSFSPVGLASPCSGQWTLTMSSHAGLVLENAGLVLEMQGWFLKMQGWFLKMQGWFLKCRDGS